MRFGELVFRAGAGVVAFLVGYAQCMLLAVVPQVPCSGPDNDPYFASLAMGAALAPLLLLSVLGLHLRGMLRWLALPFVALVPLAARGVLPFFDAAAIDAMHVCSASVGWASASAPTWWHRAWAPLQLGLLLALSLQCIRYWLPAPSGPGAPLS